MIRQAEKEDVKQVVPLLLNAMYDIAFMLTGGKTESEVVENLEYLFKKRGNRLSFENTLVKEVEGKFAGVIVCYHGSDSKKLDSPIIYNLRENTGKEIHFFDKEAEEDEFYIDTLSVSKNFRGKGLGTDLIKGAERISKERGHKKISLNVDVENVRAYNLYSKLGYRVDKEILINNHKYFHMIKKIH
ncbi:GNAT family N-acetyltransferase [Clostridium sardiniense]|uniref:GNAT family N-acetyltransferase n=1 Tax=Clostridium sardiniense TaxID=29369 RepID=A0ABS7L1H7_CLOSR|nr:GNAT family N-acetyltransferase [Clostridium sardiniense]MBY0756908.1 GNAT family N-acetyltransferase [Clostridium sardiniense]MDQ0458753.1 ribosomal protein S18 acetylase RimI-like enzyme [Clostridium sardiniense]